MPTVTAPSGTVPPAGPTGITVDCFERLGRHGPLLKLVFAGLQLRATNTYAQEAEITRYALLGPVSR